MSAIPSFGYNILLNNPSCVTYEDLLALSDNLDAPSVEEQIHIGEAVQLQFFFSLLCVEGRCRYRVNLEDYELSANQLIMIPPNAIIEYFASDKDTRVCVFLINHDIAEYIPMNDPTTLRLLGYFRHKPIQVSLPVEHTGIIVQNYRHLRSIAEQEDFPYKLDFLRGYRIQVGSLLVYALEQREVEQRPQTRQEQLFKLFLRYVQEDCGKQRSVSYYAERLFVSPKYLSRVVKEASGRLPSAWIDDYVLLRAKAMLRSSTHTVSQVADALHFPNASFFGKYFRQHTGLTPKSYQQGSSEPIEGIIAF